MYGRSGAGVRTFSSLVPRPATVQTAATYGTPVNALTIDFEDWYQGLEIPMDRWACFEDRPI